MFSEPTTLITEGIRVTVRAAYIKEESNPRKNRYVFAYQINISNESRESVQLMRRKWLITDAYGRKRIVQGAGVIGRQPELAPGESHQYTSGCDFTTPLGKMEGFFFMIRINDGSDFRVRIPSFPLVKPEILN